MDEVHAWYEQNIPDYVHHRSFDHHFQARHLADVQGLNKFLLGQ